VLHGADAVAAHTATYSKLYPFVRPALVNGAAGAVVAQRGRLLSVMAFTVSSGTITAIDAVVDPERLVKLELNLRGE
jgi:RNA polymerase sigma-70 factor (ECF subfamily)